MDCLQVLSSARASPKSSVQSCRPPRKWCCKHRLADCADASTRQLCKGVACTVVVMFPPLQESELKATKRQICESHVFEVFLYSLFLFFLPMHCAQGVLCVAFHPTMATNAQIQVCSQYFSLAQVTFQFFSKYTLIATACSVIVICCPIPPKFGS